MRMGYSLSDTWYCKNSALYHVSHFFSRRKGAYGMLPMHMAALNGHLDCMKKLLAHAEQFDIDTVDDLNRTCLHAAACGG